ncbi:Beta-galactosidase [hydrothermal vent metagenome]|uniref:Beta-galactosidase n=1 Tax=hydrothermal vent metagenome TaxID=652676 RepID=A0A3B1C1P1_9ZZZZ
MKFLLFAIFLISGATGGGSLETLHLKLKEVKSISATFVQTQNIKEFKNPVISKGKFYFRAPALLLWETDEPFRHVMLIKNSTITIHYPDIGHTETRELSKDAVSKAVAHSISSFFKGDLEAIRDIYEVNPIQNGKDSVTLQLTPKSIFEARVTRSVILRFASNHIKAIEINGKDGGRTTIEFTNVIVNPALDDNVFTIK